MCVLCMSQGGKEQGNWDVSVFESEIVWVSVFRDAGCILWFYAFCRCRALRGRWTVRGSVCACVRMFAGVSIYILIRPSNSFTDLSAGDYSTRPWPQTLTAVLTHTAVTNVMSVFWVKYEVIIKLWPYSSNISLILLQLGILTGDLTLTRRTGTKPLNILLGAVNPNN